MIVPDQHKLWATENFELPSKHKLIGIVLNNQIKRMEKLKITTELQKYITLLDDDIENMDNSNYMTIDNIYSEDDYESNENNKHLNNNDENNIYFPEYENINKKKQKEIKKLRELNIHKMRNTDEEDNIYEIEEIIKHTIKDNKYIFLVKWQGYGSKQNSWVKEDDFTSKDTVKDYFCKNNIIYK